MGHRAGLEAVHGLVDEHGAPLRVVHRDVSPSNAFLSVHGDETTKVRALDAGADDYLTKPFGMEELRARIQAVVRRVVAEPGGAANSIIHAGALEMDLANRRVLVAGEEVHFTPQEYDILRLLATHAGKVMTHRAILSAVWGPEYADMTHYVRIYVNQIRKKLGENPVIEQAIRSMGNEQQRDNLISSLLSIANTISSSRPGVRDDEIGHYVQRLTQIEAIAHEFEGVDKAFVLQAGRALRVLVSNTVLEDDELDDLAQNLAQRIQREVLYPGQIKISVLREFRSVELAH